MNQMSYIFTMFSPTIVLFVLVLAVRLLSWYKEKLYLSVIFNSIATNAFPGILKEKITEDGDVATWIDNESLLLKNDEKLKSKIKVTLILVSILLISNIAQLFGMFLFMRTTNYCDATVDCFLEGSSSNSPKSCAELDKINGSKAIICYEIVFNLPEAVGLCYGIFKTCTVSLGIATTLLINYSKINLEKQILECCTIDISLIKFLVFLICVVCTSSTLTFYHGPLHNVSDWEEVSTKATVFLMSLTTSLFVCVMPWKELVELKQIQRTAGEHLVTPLLTPNQMTSKNV